jgi:hypothetical protein
VLSSPSLLWDGYLSSDDNDDEVLAPQTPLASAKGVVSGLVLGVADQCHVEKAPEEPYGDLSATAATALGDEEG